MKELLSLYTKYNLWANKKICGFILDAGEEAADKKIISSFDTIRKTLYHIWDAQSIWLLRLTGESLLDWPSKNFKGSLETACNEFYKKSEDIINFVEEMTEEQLNSECNYSSMDGKEFSNKISGLIMHCMNHSTFHRGQIVTMLRNTGYTNLSSTDLVTYLRENKS